VRHIAPPQFADVRDARLSEVDLAEAFLLKTNLNGSYLDKAEATKARLF
jgi:uncharacterized protein YjbI with pentapeptide repeats